MDLNGALIKKILQYIGIGKDIKLQNFQDLLELYFIIAQVPETTCPHQGRPLHFFSPEMFYVWAPTTLHITFFIAIVLWSQPVWQFRHGSYLLKPFPKNSSWLLLEYCSSFLGFQARILLGLPVCSSVGICFSAPDVFFPSKWKQRVNVKAKVWITAHMLLPCLLCSAFSTSNPSHHWLSMDRSVDDPTVKPQAL